MKRNKVFLALFSTLILTVTQAQAGELLNKRLPDWIGLDLQLRHRYEWRSDFDFSEATHDNDGFHLWQTRLGITLKPTKFLKLFYELQDARISDDSTRGSKATFEDWMDTRQLWLSAQWDQAETPIWGVNKASFKFGRQELSFGSQRLVGPVNWSNVGQSFDAGRLSFQFGQPKLSIDAFGGDKASIKSPRQANDLFDGSSHDRLSGYYAVYAGIEGLVLDQYFLNRDTSGKTVSFGQVGDGEVDDYTIGLRAKGKLSQSPIDYEFEIARQFGDSGQLDVDASMAVLIVGYTFKHAWKPRLGFEFDYASGDSDRNDGKRKTFDNLFPTNHLFYGYMDFVSLQNINNYRFQINAFPHKKLELEANLHVVYLDTAKDNLYGANQLVKRATAPGADRHVGNEIDLLAKYKICDYAVTWLGYSHFFSGSFLDDTGSSSDADFVYVQTTLSF